jgi:GNAT superfamily N-acetyltransferase
LRLPGVAGFAAVETLISETYLKRLGFDDLAGIRAHLLSLDMVSRNRRFHCGFGKGAVAAYVGGLDFAEDILFGAVEPHSNRVVGVAEARPGRAPRTMELGISVLATHRRRGIAHQLSERVVEIAFATGVRAVELMFDPGDLAARRIAAGLGGRVRASGHAVVDPKNFDWDRFNRKLDDLS